MAKCPWLLCYTFFKADSVESFSPEIMSNYSIRSTRSNYAHLTLDVTNPTDLLVQRDSAHSLIGLSCELFKDCP